MGNTEIKNKRHCLFLVHLHYTDTCDAHVICTLKSRQRKRWEDNIREWTGLDFTKSKRAVENREKWRKLVMKSSVCGAPTTLVVRG